MYLVLFFVVVSKPPNCIYEIKKRKKQKLKINFSHCQIFDIYIHLFKVGKKGISPETKLGSEFFTLRSCCMQASTYAPDELRLF